MHCRKWKRLLSAVCVFLMIFGSLATAYMATGMNLVYGREAATVGGTSVVTTNTTETTASTETANDATTETAAAAGPDISSPSAILMEASTGQVVYEKNADESLHPASITKIMTLILIFDALSSGKISLTDEVPVSEHAASMGGSQVFLEPGETQTVDTMIKCISMASANDACVAFH